MRIAVLADFKHDTLRNTQVIARKIHKGFLRNGHDVMALSYRNLLMQLSPVKSKRIARRFGKKPTDEFCCELLGDYQPQIVLFLTFRNLDCQTVDLLRGVIPDTVFVGWNEDSLDGLDGPAKEIIKRLDWFLATGAGEYLKKTVKSCGVRGAFMPNPCDPDVEKPYDVSKDYRCDVLFTGKLSHKSRGTDHTRQEMITNLVDRYNMIVYGSHGKPAVLGVEYYRRISAAKIAISINASNDIRMYHSDRLINYLACGAFVLAKSVPDGDILFENGRHLCYFNTPEQCFELVEYYLQHDDERRAIAERGMQRAHKMFHCERIAKDIVDLVTTESYDEPWTEIY